MSPEEAIRRIKNHNEVHSRKEKHFAVHITEALNMAVEALEKQIPKKATEEENNRGIDISGEYDIDFHLCCPVCGAVVGTYEAGVNEYYENYCSNCGQAIDVSYSGCEEGAEK